MFCLSVEIDFCCVDIWSEDDILLKFISFQNRSSLILIHSFSDKQNTTIFFTNMWHFEVHSLKKIMFRTLNLDLFTVSYIWSHPIPLRFFENSITFSLISFQLNSFSWFLDPITCHEKYIFLKIFFFKTSEECTYFQASIFICPNRLQFKRRRELKVWKQYYKIFN